MIKKWWNKFRDEDLIKSGMSIVKTSLFIGLFTIGFVFFKWKIYGVTNARETLDILLNGSLWIFSVSVFIFFCYLHSGSVKFRCITGFLAKSSFEFFAGLVFILIAGFSVNAFSIPFIDLKDFYAYIAFFEFVIFLLLSVSMSIIMDSKDPKRATVLLVLRIVAFSFLIISVLRTIYS